jgi:archaeosortase A (PGF-CTERM-specific)
MTGPLTDLYAWVIIAAFCATTLVGTRSVRRARTMAAGSWVLFAGFWLVLVPHFAFTQRSYVEGVLCVVAVPACLYVAYLVYEERPSLLILTRAVAVMGLVYFPFQAIVPLQRASIETVTLHAHWLMESFGFDTAIYSCDGLRGAGYSGFTCLNPYESMFLTTGMPGGPYLTPVLLACTGIGSISIVVGLVLAVGGTLRQKASAVAIAVPVIYGLNVLRVAFIVVAHAEQWFRGPLLTGVVSAMFGIEDAQLVSYYVADRVIAQSLSVVALVVIGWALIRVIPSLALVLEELLYILTGEEREFGERFA